MTSPLSIPHLGDNTGAHGSPVRDTFSTQVVPVDSMKAASREMRFIFGIVVVATTVGFSSSRAIGASWLPVCPDGTECATTFLPFVSSGKILISSTAKAGPNHWIDPTRLLSVETPMHLASLRLSQGYMAVDLTGGIVYDANGQLLYSFDHTGFGPEASGWNFETLGPAVALGGTIVTGVAFPGSLPKIYQSRDEGRTWLAQTANIDVRPVYVNGAIPVSYTHLTLPTNREV